MLYRRSSMRREYVRIGKKAEHRQPDATGRSQEAQRAPSDGQSSSKVGQLPILAVVLVEVGFRLFFLAYSGRGNGFARRRRRRCATHFLVSYPEQRSAHRCSSNAWTRHSRLPRTPSPLLRPPPTSRCTQKRSRHKKSPSPPSITTPTLPSQLLAPASTSPASPLAQQIW